MHKINYASDSKESGSSRSEINMEDIYGDFFEIGWQNHEEEKNKKVKNNEEKNKKESIKEEKKKLEKTQNDLDEIALTPNEIKSRETFLQNLTKSQGSIPNNLPKYFRKIGTDFSLTEKLSIMKKDLEKIGKIAKINFKF